MLDQLNTIIKELGIEPTDELLNSTAGKELLDAALTVENKKNRLRELGEQITEKIERVNKRMGTETLPLVNPLGELQSTGQQYETVCAELAAAIETAKILARIVKTTAKAVQV